MRLNPPRWWCSPFAKQPLPLQVIITPLQGPGDRVLPASGISLRLVDTVPAVHPADPHQTVRQWPDVLRDLPGGQFVAQPGRTQALWLSVQVPAGATAGEYRGEVRLTAAGEAWAVPVTMRVFDVLLPNAGAWALRVDFWQGFGHLARQYQVPEWGEEWWRLVEAYLRDLAAHGQSVVQVGRGHFDWRRTADNQWEFGFERFDRYVELCTRLGLTGPIEYLQMFDGRGDTTLHWTQLGVAEKAVANPGAPLFDEVWEAFGRALAEHCRTKGWLERLYVCPTDEPQDVYGPPTLERFQRAVTVLRRADRAHRTTCALDSLTSAKTLAPLLDRFVFKLRADVYDAAWARELRSQGKLVEAYICCHPDRPNSFITSDPLEQRVLGWICWQEGFQGLLRWSYVNWPPDPFGQPAGDGRYTAGDLFIVYPGEKGPLASSRWERMRDGFEDYEMLRAVQRLIVKAPVGPDRAAAEQALEQALNQVAGPAGQLTRYTTDPAALLTARHRLLACAEKLR